MHSAVPIERVSVESYTIPTDQPEADGYAGKANAAPDTAPHGAMKK